MSAFIVNNSTIHRCVHGMVYAKQAAGYSESLGQLLYDMNAEAVAERYSEPVSEVTFEPSDEPVSKISAVKALHCLRYQCSNGAVPQKYLFKKLSTSIETLSEDIVCNLPEWNEVPWDG